MALKLIPPGQGSELREYYIRFEGSMYGVLRVDNEAHTVNLVPLKEIDNFPVVVEPLNPYELCGCSTRRVSAWCCVSSIGSM